MFDFPLPRITAEIRSVFLKGDKGDPGDTGPAGPQGDPGKAPRVGENDNWETYDNETQEWTDTGVCAKSVRSYSELTDVPETFPPDAHEHEAKDVSGLSAVATSGVYADLSDAPQSVSQFENDANYQTDAQVAQAIADIEIGGRNYALNSSKEIGGTYHDRRAPIGNYDLTGAIRELNHDEKSFVVSFYGKGSGVAEVTFRSKENAIISDQCTLNCTAEYQRYSVEIHLIDQFSSADMYFVSVYVLDSGNISVKNMKVERGGKSTDWTPAPEDADRAISCRAAATFDYSGRNLKDVFGTAEALHAALVAEDYSNIAVGDYWPITLNGTFWDYGSYTFPAGKTAYTNPECTESGGSNSIDRDAAYYSETAITYTDTHGVKLYGKLSDCLPYFERTCNNVTVNLEVAGINHYWRYGDSGELTGRKPHVVFISRDCLPVALRMRKGAAKWEDTSVNNPWLGSAMYKTLNAPEHGIIHLVESTDIGAYLYDGPNHKGMRALLEIKAPDVGNATGAAWQDRGKLFLPSVAEVWGHPFWTDMNWEGGLGNQFAIFQGSRRHIVKGMGDGNGAYPWRLASSQANDITDFATAGNLGEANHPASNIATCAPICFVAV